MYLCRVPNAGADKKEKSRTLGFVGVKGLGGGEGGYGGGEGGGFGGG